MLFARKRNGNGAVVAIVAVCLLACGSTVRAQITWDNASGDGWWNLTSANWDGGNYYDGADVIFGDTAPGTVNVAAGLTPGSVTVSNGNYTLQGAGWGGSGGLTKAGSGALILSGDNTYSGITTISGGTLQVSSAANLGTSAAANAITIGGSATLRLLNDAGTNFAKNVTYNGHANVHVGQAQGGSGVNQTHTLGNWTNAGTFNVTFTNDNGYGLTVGQWTGSTGNLKLYNNMAAPGVLTIDGPYLDVKHLGSPPNVFGGSGHTVVNALIRTAGGPNAYIAKQGSGTLTLTNDGSTWRGDAGASKSALYLDQGTVEFTSIANWDVASALGAPTSDVRAHRIPMGNDTTLRYIGTLPAGHSTNRTIQVSSTRATIEASGAGPLVFTGNFETGTNRTLTLSGTNTGANTISSAIPGTGFNVTKDGPGTWVLAGDNSYTGATTVNAGTLLVNNTSGSGTGTGAVTVGAGGTLGGTGTIAPGGANGIAVSGTVAPGASIGTLTFDLGNTTGKVEMLTGGTFTFELEAPGSNDLVQFFNYSEGDFILNDTTINFLVPDELEVGTYDLFEFYSDAGTTLTASGLTSGLVIGTGLESYSGSYLDYTTLGKISLTVIPEPGTLLLLAAGLLFLLAGPRRRRRR